MISFGIYFLAACSLAVLAGPLVVDRLETRRDRQAKITRRLMGG